VLAGVLVITIGALAVFDVAAVTALRTYLLGQANRTVTSALAATRARLTDLLPADRTAQLEAELPVFGEYYIAFVPARGKVVELQVVPGAPGATWQAVSPAMVAVARIAARAQDRATPVRAPTTVTFGAARQYALGAVTVPAQRGTLVAGTDLKDVDTTVRRLELIVTAGSAAAALLIFVGVGLVMRQGLRPIETMASQADAITAGDLTGVVGPAGAVGAADAGSEVGRLGAALNGMLARIGASVAEREASQELMRRFFADASHELRTPLASLRAHAELYQQGALTRRVQVDEAMRRIGLEAQRMSRLVDDMLRLARLDQHPARQHDPVDLSAVVRSCVERAASADPARTWQPTIAAGLVAEGDEELLGRAVDNLLANVRAHTPAGTAASVIARDDGRGGVVVQVSDDGPGVPADRLPRIFDRFYRAGAPSHQPGSGLGLAIVTEIASAHSGAVEAALNDPHGLRVTLTLPGWRPSDDLARSHSLRGAGQPDEAGATAPA
jgi:two-component system, OmpR family, sensor kinase